MDACTAFHTLLYPIPPFSSIATRPRSLCNFSRSEQIFFGLPIKFCATNFNSFQSRLNMTKFFYLQCTNSIKARKELRVYVFLSYESLHFRGHWTSPNSLPTYHRRKGLNLESSERFTSLKRGKISPSNQGIRDPNPKRLESQISELRFSAI